MAMHAGLGVSKFIFLVGAGYTGGIMLRNNKLSDILGEIQKLVQNSGDSSSTDSDALSDQVRRLAMEVRNMASSRQITILNNGDSSQIGNLASLAMPAAALGAVGYGYMWWKGLSFSDLMYVTKHNMQTAVANMTKHLDQVTCALSATKRHLTQRIENLDGKLDDQKELSKGIKMDVSEVKTDLSQIGMDLDRLQNLICGLDGKMMTLEEKQDYANAGVWYLVNAVAGKNGKMLDPQDQKMLQLLKNLPKDTKPPRGGLMNVLEFADDTTIGAADNAALVSNDVTTRFTRTTASIKC